MRMESSLRTALHGSLISGLALRASSRTIHHSVVLTVYVYDSEDMFTPDSVDQLQKAGIDFQRHEELGILPNDFAELMITSGLVLSPDTKWISFHRCVWTSLIHEWQLNFIVLYSGYDFGYFVKLLTAESLPTTEDAFFALLKIWFPTVYDIKYLTKASKGLKGGLQEVADDLGV